MGDHLAGARRLPDRCDVVIVGAGIVGASILYHLAAAERGLEVCCFDKSHKLHGSTARSAAAFRHQFTSRAHVRASILSSQELESFPARFGTSPVIRRNGYCFVYTDAAAFDAARVRVAHQRALGVPDLEILSAAETRARFPALAPEGLQGATFCRHDGFVLPDAVTNGYFEAGEAIGGCLRQYAAVTGLEREAGRVSGVIVDGEHLVRARTVINAAGPWGGQVAASFGAPIPLVPLKRYLYFTSQLRGRDVTGFPMFVLDLETYCRPEANSLMLGWDRRPPKPVGWDRFPSSPESLEPLDPDRIDAGFGTGLDDYGFTVLAEVAGYLPFLEDEVGLDAVSAGYYEVTPDEKGIIGWDPRVPGLLHATGFSGHGVMHAPATGQLVRALILDETPPMEPAAFALSPLLENQPRPDPEGMVI